MRQDKGNRAKVTDRWYTTFGQERIKRLPHKEFKGEPQFKFDDIYCSPFTQKRSFNDDGKAIYSPLTVNLAPTGVHVLDEYIKMLHSGSTDVASLSARYNASTNELSGMVFLLTGMTSEQFRNRWVLRSADALLRYTDLTIAEVARRSGAGTRNNLYFFYERELNCAPTTRRKQLRKEGDVGRYK